MRRALLLMPLVAGLMLGGCDAGPGQTPATKTATTAPAPTPQAKNSFKGAAVVELLHGDGSDDRRIKLVYPFTYIDPDGVDWTAPASYVSDGASIPWGLWTFVGGPFDGPYRDAAILHDYFCEKKDRPWDKVHLMFYNAAIARGVSETRASTMYAGILYGGPRWELAAAPATTPGAAPAPTAPKKSGYLPGLVTEAQAQTSTPTPAKPAAPAVTQPGIAARSPTVLEKQVFDELQAWIAREKPKLPEIEKKVEELRAKAGLPPLPKKP